MDIKDKLDILIKDYERNNVELSEYAKGRLSAFKTILNLIKNKNRIPFIPKEQRCKKY